MYSSTGEVVCLTCPLKRPFKDIAWQGPENMVLAVGDHVAENYPSIKVISDHNESELCIENITATDIGRYGCYAINSYNTQMFHVKLKG